MSIHVKYNIMELMMDNKEFFQLLKDTKKEMEKVSTKVDTLYTKLFIGNGQKSFDKRVTLLENNQLNCPARKNTGVDHKALKVSIVMAFISCCAIVISLISLFN